MVNTPENPSAESVPKHEDLKQSLPDAGEAEDEGLERFIGRLQQNREQATKLLKDLEARPDQSIEESALAFYLDFAVNRLVFGVDVSDEPLSAATGKGQTDTDRMMRVLAAAGASMATARFWLTNHPESRVARKILKDHIRAPAQVHMKFLRELWPSIAKLLPTVGYEPSGRL